MVNAPPMTTRPSDWSTRALIFPLTLGSYVVSSVPLAFSRAIRLRVTPLTSVNDPAMITRPSACTATAETAPLGAGLNAVSTEPSGRKRIRLPPVVLLRSANAPPRITLPSGCTAIALTSPLSRTLGLKAGRGVPFGLSQAKPATGVAVRAPLARMITVLTVPSAASVLLKPASAVPSGRKRATLADFAPPRSAKLPTAMTLPSVWTARPLTTAPVAPPALASNVASTAPVAASRAKLSREIRAAAPAG